MNNRIVVIGASAGGIEVLIEFLKHLPADINCTIFIVLHLNASQKSLLLSLLQKHSALPLAEAKDREVYKRNHAYLCPQNKHMMINSNFIELTVGPKINHFRPSIEPLFNSAAVYGGVNTIGILLSGLMSDGVEGLQAIKNNGGITIVQDPSEAKFPDLPSNALATGSVDHCLPIHEIVETLKDILKNNSPAKVIKNEKKQDLEKIFLRGGRGEQTDSETLNLIGDPSVFTCPDCSGTLWEILDKDSQIFRCRTGHQYNLDSLKMGQDEEVESALWTAIRALEESSNISTKIAKQMTQSSRHSGATLYETKAREAQENANILRGVIDSIL